jgi:hypothetical protein
LPPQWSHTTTTGKETLLLLLLPPPPTPATAVLRLCCLVTVAAVYTVHVQVTERSAARQTFFSFLFFFRRGRDGDKLTECLISTAGCASVLQSQMDDA